VIQDSGIKSKWTKRRKILVAIAVPIAISLLVIMPGLAWELHKASTAIHFFTDALIAKQYKQAYESTCVEFRATTDYPTFVKVHDGLTLRMGDLNKVEVSEMEIKERSDGWHGTADVDMKFARGSLAFVFVLKKENQSWKIYSYHEQ
jgi:hypothetical protein